MRELTGYTPYSPPDVTAVLATTGPVWNRFADPIGFGTDHPGGIA